MVRQVSSQKHPSTSFCSKVRRASKERVLAEKGLLLLLFFSFGSTFGFSSEKARVPFPYTHGQTKHYPIHTEAGPNSIPSPRSFGFFLLGRRRRIERKEYMAHPTQIIQQETSESKYNTYISHIYLFLPPPAPLRLCLHTYP